MKTPDFEKMHQTLEERGVPMSAFLTEAKIAQTTWWRWRSGETLPRMAKWQDVQEAFDRLTGKGA